MIPPSVPASISCPIGLYQKQEEEIARFTAAINSSAAVPDKVRAAQNSATQRVGVAELRCL